MKKIFLSILSLTSLAGCVTTPTVEDQRQKFGAMKENERIEYLLSELELARKYEDSNAMKKMVESQRILDSGFRNQTVQEEYIYRAYSCIDQYSKRRTTRSDPFGTDCVVVEKPMYRDKTIQVRLTSSERAETQKVINSIKFTQLISEDVASMYKDLLLNAYKKDSPFRAFEDLSKIKLSYYGYVSSAMGSCGKVEAIRNACMNLVKITKEN